MLLIYFYYSYETGNGISVAENGQLKPGGPEGIQTVYGSFSYPGEDGKLITVTYTADENGFVPKGSHLPTPPPIPAEILQSLEQNAAEEAAQQAYQQQAAYAQSGSATSYGQESGVNAQSTVSGVSGKSSYPGGSYGDNSAAGSYGQTSSPASYGQTSVSGSYGQSSTFAPKQLSYQKAGEQSSGSYGQSSGGSSYGQAVTSPGSSYKSQQGYQGHTASAVYKKPSGASAY